MATPCITYKSGYGICIQYCLWSNSVDRLFNQCSTISGIQQHFSYNVISKYKEVLKLVAHVLKGVHDHPDPLDIQLRNQGVFITLKPLSEYRNPNSNFMAKKLRTTSVTMYACSTLYLLKNKIKNIEPQTQIDEILSSPSLDQN